MDSGGGGARGPGGTPVSPEEATRSTLSTRERPETLATMPGGSRERFGAVAPPSSWLGHPPPRVAVDPGFRGIDPRP